MTTTRDEIIIRELHPLPKNLAQNSSSFVQPAGLIGLFAISGFSQELQ